MLLTLATEINKWCVFYPHYIAFLIWYALQQFGTI